MRLLTALLLALAPLAASAQEAPRDLRLFLLIGQSNMAGRGKVEPTDQETTPRILMLDKTTTWVPARDPVHFDKPVAGVGLCSQFARDIAKARPDLTLGLIPCAVGGTSLDQWKAGGPLYSNAVARARVAQRNGTLAGILWHQGEADSGRTNMVATYPDRFAALVTALRRDLAAENVPVLVGELGRYRPAFSNYNAMLPHLAARVPHCTVVSSEGLIPNADNLHFSAAALRTFGSRYAEAFLKAGPFLLDPPPSGRQDTRP